MKSSSTLCGGVIAALMLLASCGLYAQVKTTSSPNLPPIPGKYISPAEYHQLYANGIIIKDVSHLDFTGNLPPPPPAGTQVHSFNSMVQMKVSTDGGTTFTPTAAPGSVQVRVQSTTDIGSTRFFDTEMLSLNLSGGGLPPGVMVRESPTLASTGKTQITLAPDGSYKISSFFDVNTEMTLDGGATWSPATGSTHVALEGDPPGSVVSTSSNLPPIPSHYVSPAEYHQLYAIGVIIKDVSHEKFTQNQPPPPAPGGTQTHSFGSAVRMQVSTDGGSTFSPMVGVASVAVSVHRTADSGSTQNFQTEMLQMDLSGGSLPPGVMVRESPTRASLGKTTIQVLPDGSFRIGSFFDIFTELSVDGGATWNPAVNGSTHMEVLPDPPPIVTTEPNLPPMPSHYVSPAEWHQLYANGIILTDISHERFTQNQPPPGPGLTQTHSFGSMVSMQVSTDGGSTFQQYSAPADVSVQVRHTSDSGPTQSFDTEMLQLSLSGGNLPAGVMVRESPTLASTGKSAITLDPGGLYRINSFFDVFTELSLDGGSTWSPATAAAQMVLQNAALPPAVTVGSPNLPPIPSHYVSPEEYHQQYANGIIIKDVSHEAFTHNDPPPDTAQVHSFGSTVTMMVSVDGGNTFDPVEANGNVSVRVTHTEDSGPTSYYNTEMLSLDLSGGTLPPGTMVRESPTRRSAGRTSVMPSGGGEFEISSFFDIFTELSLDGGATWSPTTTPTHMEAAAVHDSVSGTKYADLNGNGSRDPGEPGLSGWKITATNTSTSQVFSALTDGAGNYTFAALPPGPYRIEEVLQSGWMQTGGNPYYDVTIPSAVLVTGVDFGNFMRGSVCGAKYDDLNGNGIRDDGEPGLPGWTICITRDPDPRPPNVFPTTGGTDYLGTTLAQVRVNFFHPPLNALGTVELCAKGPTTIQRANPSGSTAGDSMETEITLLELVGTLPPPLPNDTFIVRHKADRRSYGLIQGNSFPASSFFDVFYEIELPASAGGMTLVNRDPTNMSTVINTIPPGAANYLGFNTYLVDKNNPTDTVGLIKTVNHCVTPDSIHCEFNCPKPPPPDPPAPPGTAQTCVTTDGDGNYCFPDLPPGTYHVREIQQTGWVQTTADPGPITIGSGSSATGVDFGNHTPTICGLVYDDLNHNQQQDPGEPGIPDVTISVTGPAASSVQTDANGEWCAGAPLPGTYSIDQTAPAGYVQLFPKSGGYSVEVTDQDVKDIVFGDGAAATLLSYRTASMAGWATAVDAKGKLKAVKCKPVSVDFKFNLVAPGDAGGLTVKFSMLTTGALTRGKAKTDTLAVWNSSKTMTYTAPIAQGETVQVDGHGFKGKPVKSTAYWSTIPKKTTARVAVYKQNVPRLPMPNLHNVGEELERQTAFPVTVGASSGAASVTHLKYKDIQKSLNYKGTLHTGPADCLRNLKQLKSMPPKKIDNRLFAQAIALMLNVAASDKQKFPAGLGDLIYDNHKDTSDTSSSFFNGKTVREILFQVNAFLSCTSNPKAPADAGDYEEVIKRINDAFDGPVDTLSWSCNKLYLKGVRILKDVPFLRANPGATRLVEPPASVPLPAIPAEYSLSQNYPNPFNPTTTIQFDLPEPAVVTMTVYNTLGQEVAVLIDHELFDEGTDEVEFDATGLPSGVYIYKLTATGVVDEDEGILGKTFVSERKMLFLK